jgi:hypothetical protein
LKGKGKLGLAFNSNSVNLTLYGVILNKEG